MRIFLLSIWYILLAGPLWAETIHSPSFVSNKGQWEPSVLYRAEVPGGFVFVKKQSLVYVFYHTGDLARQHPNIGESLASRQVNTPPSDLIRAHGYEVHFLGSSTQAPIEAYHKYDEVRNYFLGNDPSKWAESVPSFSEIVYKNIYPGINLRLFSQAGSLKYECIVAPGADPTAIQFRYEGMENLTLNNGFLITETTVNKVTEMPPYSYQVDKMGTKKEVASEYIVKKNIVSFHLPNGYNRKASLVIDPVLVFATYSGSYTDNWGYTATYDNGGHLYSGGIEFGGQFPVSTGAFQTTFAGQTDIAIIKYTPQGGGRVYATYIGGNQAEAPHSMIVDKDNQLIILGTTSSMNFPVSANAYDRTFNGGTSVTVTGIPYQNGSDIFITKLNANATSLVGSTYLGGSANDGLAYNSSLEIFNYGDEFRGEVNLDANGAIYIASTSFSVNFPMVNAAQSIFGGTQDGVVCQLTTDVSTLTWSTYLGGAGFDAVRGIRISPKGVVYAVGGTNSNNLPASTDAIHNSSSGKEEGFVVKYINGQLSRLSYLGTAQSDQAYQIDIDENENAYLLGLTLGSYLVTPGTFSNSNGAQFVHAINSEFTQTIFSTVIGSGNHQLNISPTAFMRNSCGLIYIAGWGGNVNVRSGVVRTRTSGLPVTTDAIRSGTTGDDYYLAILNQNASQLLYGTFFGSQSGTNHVDGGTSRFSPSGTIYHAACACRDNNSFPVTAGAWSTKNNGALSSGCNNAAFKFDLEGLKADFRVTADSCRTPVTVTLQNVSEGGKSYEWVVDGQVRFTNATPGAFLIDTEGEHTITLRAYNPITCKKVDSLSKKIMVTNPKFAIVPDSTICRGESVQLFASGGNTYTWSSNIPTKDIHSPTPTVTPTQTTTYTVDITTPYGCSRRLSTTIFVLADFNPDFSVVVYPQCDAPTRLQLVTDSIRGNAEWILIQPNGVSMPVKDTVTATMGGTYQIILKVLQGKCEKIIRKDIEVEDPRPPVNVITPNTPNTHFETFKRGWKVEIYDQWGRPVYVNDVYQNDWTGDSVKNGVYYYRLTSPEGLYCKGWIHVLK